MPASIPLVALVERERAILAQIAAGQPIGVVLEALLHAVEGQSGHEMLTSVLFLSDDEQHLTHGAAPSLPEHYNSAIDGIAIGEGVGSCGTAAARGQPVYVADIQTDPLWTNFRVLAAECGLRACWSSPIRAASERVLGTFAIYYREPRVPTPDDIQAIAFITQTAGLAIERHLSDQALRRSQEELKSANERLAQLVTTRTQERDRLWSMSRDPMLIADHDGNWLSASPAWTQVLGWKDDELIGHTSEWIEHPDDTAKTRNEVDYLASGGTTMRFENRLRTKQGEYRTFSWTAVPDEEFLYCIARDVTDERSQEAQMELAQDALRQAQKMEAVGQLTGGLAHDFNNMLAGISGSLELAQARLSQLRLPEVDRFVTAAQGAAKRAAALTHCLLAFSRRQTLTPEPTNVNRLISGIEDLIRRTVGPQVALEVVGATGVWPALIDPHQLENAVLNLCINARDAMPEGGRITIETANKWLDEQAAKTHDMEPGQYLSICVTDTGTGMSADTQSRAFEPFFTTKPIGQGTGLGLSMIYGFVRQSGGQVRIYSELGTGTTICLYLPRHYGETAEETDKPDKVALPPAEAGETILVVDDEPTVRMLVVEVLEELNYAVIEAADSVSGLRVLQSDMQIDLLITDVGLPGGMNGRQLADAALAARPSLKVLFITGYAENALLGNGQLEPGMQVMTKPFAIDSLGARIKQLLP